MNIKRIIVSRTDNLGDVVLTFPLCGLIKSRYPETRIIFLGKGYTRPLIERCSHVDEFLDLDEIRRIPGEAGQVAALQAVKADAILHVFPEKLVCRLAQKARIPVRIATLRRLFTLTTCNYRINIPRRHSPLHESQLNLKLLRPLGIESILSLQEIAEYYGLSTRSGQVQPAPGGPFRLILHPRSKGSAREWGTENFGRLIDLLPEERYQIFITGTREEGASIQPFLDRYRSRVTDLTGQHSLGELIDFIGGCDALVSASTGPLHIAAALGKKAIGLYAPMRPIHPGRWAPVGRDAHFLVNGAENCNDCRKSGDCHCIRSITPESVARLLSAS